MNLKKVHPVPKEVWNWLYYERLGYLNDIDYRFIVKLVAKATFQASRSNDPLIYLQPKEYKNIKTFGRTDYGLRKLGDFSDFDKKKAGRYPDVDRSNFYGTFLHPKPLFHATAYIAREKNRYFILGQWFTDEYLPRLKDALIQDEKFEFVNLFDGKVIQRREHKIFSKVVKYSPANKPLIRKAIKCIKSRPFNKKAILSHLRNLAINNKGYARFLSDLHCWTYIQLCDPKRISDEIHEYQPQYRILATGRISEIGGGLQSASKAMKFASIQGIEEVYNYDLKNSQVNGLRHQLKLCDLDTTWIDNYLSIENNKAFFSNKLCLSIQTWKESLLMIIMGASLGLKKPRKKFSNEMIKTDLALLLESELRDQLDREPEAEEVKLLRDKLKSEIIGLLHPLKLWHGKLKNGYQELGNEYRSNYRGVNRIKNMLDIPYPTSYKPAKLAARILQGQEAAFIHRLTIASLDNSYEVIGNEHDGLVTIGKIPDEVINQIKSKVGIEEYYLEVKPFI